MSSINHYNNGIVILGAGNVATHLSTALYNSGYHIKCVYSKTINTAKTLAQKFKTHYTNDVNHIPVDADLYIIAVKDEIIAQIVKYLDLKDEIIVHTAGSVSIDIFKDKFKNYGVFYPLQTFSKNRELDFSTIPICIEANSKMLENKLFNLAASLSKSVKIINSDKRKKLHLAAVFACNFANYMYSAATNILEDADLCFDLLKPLISETANKAIDCHPKKAQTGPAVRNDQNIIEMHMEMLKEYPEFKELYKLASEGIFKLNKKND